MMAIDLKLAVRASLMLSLALSTLGPVTAWCTETHQPANKFTGRIYDREKRDGAPLYTYQHEAQVDGASRRAQNTFQAPDGRVVAIEKVEFENGALKTYLLDHKQLGTEGRLEVKGNEAHFRFTKGGKTKTATEKIKENFVAGASLIAYMQKHWAKLLKGDELEVRFAVIDRLEAVGFELKKVKDIEYKDQKAVVIRMKPSSFIIAALVDPLHFTLKQDGTRLLELDGRAVPKREVGGKLKDLDAVTVYEYP